MGRFLVVISLIVALLLSACVTRRQHAFTLEEALEGKAAISIPMRVTETGLIVVEDIQIGQHSLDMILDTGATQSAIFKTALDRLDLNLTSHSDTMVHGMVQSKKHSVVNFPTVQIGSIKFLAKPMVVLDDRDPDFRKMDIYDGLIGMDILAKYQLYISPHKSELRFIPNKSPVFVSYFWPRVYLKENPFKEDDRALHFVDLRVGGRNTAAMLDTGSEFSVMNWSAATFAEAKPMRRRLREQWELQGAVGTFEPTAKVTLERFRGGQVFWDYKEFVIMDMESLDILGVENQPFIIAGMNLFKGEAFFIDFERDFLSIVPEEDAK